MNLMKGLKLGLAGLLLSFGAQASTINVGGVVWNPDQTSGSGFLKDFFMKGGITEEAAGFPGQVVSGFGDVTNINKNSSNQNQFCPLCELTYTFSMELVSFTGSAALGQFTFTNLVISFFVDKTPDFGTTPVASNAGDGQLWLKLALHPGTFLTGIGTNLGTGSDTGSGTAYLDAIGGLAAGNFNTNKKLYGSDVVLTSSFQPVEDLPGILSGTFEIRSDTIPEPMPLAILGLGLLGLAASRRQAK